jgi:hypothetical protein
MGEYATRNSDRASIKLGTCESMYYLRLSDKDKVTPDLNSGFGHLWRLPFPDEDHILPGDYEAYSRGLRLYLKTDRGHDDYAPEWLDKAEQGLVQLRHEPSGLLLNVPCHHGQRLPDLGPSVRAFWNGKGHSMELMHLRTMPDGSALPVVGCRHCGSVWRTDWAEVLPYVGDPIMRKRLECYATEPATN